MSQVSDETFIMYQGHHGDAGAHKADVILPGATYTEKDAIYVNTEGRVQQTWRAVFPPGEAKDDWKIIRALSDVLEKSLPYKTLQELRASLVRQFPHLDRIDEVVSAEWESGKERKAFKIDNMPFVYPLDNFYMTDPISRVSRSMAECVSARCGRKSEKQEAA